MRLARNVIMPETCTLKTLDGQPAISVHNVTVDWAWVKLHDLAMLLTLTTETLIKRFGDLAALYGDGEGGWTIQLHWASMHQGVCCTEDKPHQSPPTRLLNHMYVPVGWAKDVILANSLGVKRLERRPMVHRTGAQMPDGTVRFFVPTKDERTTDDRCEVAVIIAHTSEAEPSPLDTAGSERLGKTERKIHCPRP